MEQLDERHWWIISRLQEAFGLGGFDNPTVVEDFLCDDIVLSDVNDFLSAEGPERLFVHYQPPRPAKVHDDEGTAANGDGHGHDAHPHTRPSIAPPPVTLFLSHGDDAALHGKCVFFVRVNAQRPVDVFRFENEVLCGEISEPVLASLDRILGEVFVPLLSAKSDWGKASDDTAAQCIGSLMKLSASVQNAATQHDRHDIVLAKPEARYDVENKQATFNRVANNPEFVAHFEVLLEGWMGTIERVLEGNGTTTASGVSSGASPAAANGRPVAGDSHSGDAHAHDDPAAAELETWRERQGSLNAIVDQLRTAECKAVLGVLVAAKSRLLKRWKVVDASITDAANEAKDNVKYLETLRRTTSPITNGTPASIMDALPMILNGIRTVHAVAKANATKEKVTSVFVNVTAQIVAACRAYLAGEGAGNIWHVHPDEATARADACAALNKAYQEQFGAIKEKFVGGPKNRPLDLPETVVFARFERFVHNARQLVDIVVTRAQYVDLLGLLSPSEPLVERVAEFLDDIAHLREGTLAAFEEGGCGQITDVAIDAAHIEFTRRVTDIEISLRKYVNASFENKRTTEQALSLLAMFRPVAGRPGVRNELDSKYLDVFLMYEGELESVQGMYERDKQQPHLIRNSPLVAGNIAWARNLLRRIEEPMKTFREQKAVMASKEARRVFRIYNKVAGALIEFETLWHQQWCHHVDTVKAGLQATLLVQGEDGSLFVNFDSAVLELMHEARWMVRLGLRVPEAALAVVGQETRFKRYHDQLAHVIGRRERIVGRVNPVLRPLLAPHFEDLAARFKPGLVSITWSSMNIDAYLHRIHQGLARLDSLVGALNEAMESRVDRDLAAIGTCVLLDVGRDRTYTAEEFVSAQEAAVRTNAELLSARTTGILAGLQDVIRMARATVPSTAPGAGEHVPAAGKQTTQSREHPQHHHGAHSDDARKATTEQSADALLAHYARLLYHATVSAITNSLDLLRRRLGLIPPQPKTRGGKPVPLFFVDVELAIPDFTITPTLEDIQDVVGRVVHMVLGCSHSVRSWAGVHGAALVAVPSISDSSSGANSLVRQSLYGLVCETPCAVKAVLHLTGTAEGLRAGVLDQLASFRRFDALWKRDIHATYDAFLRSKPRLDDFESEIRHFLSVERDIEQIHPAMIVGPLLLVTQSLKYSLKAEAGAWKTQFAKSLHEDARRELEIVSSYMALTGQRLSKQIGTLDDLRDITQLLREVKEKDAEMGAMLCPVEERYDLLLNYEVHVPKEEADAVAALRRDWKGIRVAADGITDRLGALRVQFQRDLDRQVKAFVVDVIQFRNDFDANGPMVPGLKPADALARLSRFTRMFDERNANRMALEAGERLFGLQVTAYPELEKTEAELAMLQSLYSLYTDVTEFDRRFRGLLWSSTDFDSLATELQSYVEAAASLPERLREWEAYRELRRCLDAYAAVLPVVSSLGAAAIKNRHWLQVMGVTGKSFKVEAEYFRLGHLLDLGLLRYREEIATITHSASMELELETRMRHIEEEWSEQSLVFSRFRPTGDGPVILSPAETQRTIGLLEDSQIALASMLNSRYIAPLREEVSLWVAKLSTIGEVVEQWLVVQNMWTYLESVFSDPRIASQLPKEAKRFAMIDRSWNAIMQRAFEAPNIIHCCHGNEGLKHLLQHLTDQLELCQKSLAGYLEAKRQAFPRFYFVSDPILLGMLSNAGRPSSIVPFLKSIFDNVAGIEFDRPGPDATHITAIISEEGERYALASGVGLRGGVEEWLAVLRDELRSSLVGSLRGAMAKYRDDHADVDELAQRLPAQIAGLLAQVTWTEHAEDALREQKADRRTIIAANRRITTTLSRLTEAVRREGLTRAEIARLQLLIVIAMHQRDTFDDVVRKKVKDPTEFDWQRHVRVYFHGHAGSGASQLAASAMSAASSGPVSVSAANGSTAGDTRSSTSGGGQSKREEVEFSLLDTSFGYGFEYLGGRARLVATQLTERAFIALTQALASIRGAVPFGPSGVGKTETVKDLGRMLGRYVVVLNCSDQMDSGILGSLLKGLAQSGAFGCFDELARVQFQVLSVFAQQLHVVLSAIRAGRKTCVFTDGQHLRVGPQFGMFATMGMVAGSLSQSSLMPSNMKALFRQVAFVAPDTEVIVRVRLASMGLSEVRTIARKTVMLFRLCEEQLSRQPHYDFGLRTVLSILEFAGHEKTRRAQFIADGGAPPQSASQQPLTKQPSTANHPAIHSARSVVNLFVPAGTTNNNLSSVQAIATSQFDGATRKDVALLTQIIHDTTAPRLLEHDLPVFRALLRDMFLDVAPLSDDGSWHDSVERAIRKRASDAGLIQHTPWVSKVMELHSLALARKGIVVVGPAGAGKSKAVETLTAALSAMGSGMVHKVQRFNTCALTNEQLFGHFDGGAGRDWIDGVFSALLRKAVKAKNTTSWFCFDGPIAAPWTETLANALDESGTLTLVNGDRLPMATGIRLVFETTDLRFASPGAISRCGVVYVGESVLGWKPMVESWLQTRPPEEALLLRPLFERYVDKTLRFVNAESQTTRMRVCSVGLLSTCTALLAALLGTFVVTVATAALAPPATPMPTGHVGLSTPLPSNSPMPPATPAPRESREVDHRHERVFTFALVWSVGGLLPDGERAGFTELLRSLCPSLPTMDPGFTIFDYYLDETGEWDLWQSMVPIMRPGDAAVPAFTEPFVETAETVRVKYLLGLAADERRNVLLVGAPGSGKTSIIADFLSSRETDSQIVKRLVYSGATNASGVQQFVETCVQRRQGRTFGAENGKRLCAFVDDINLPATSIAGEQPANEVLRQLVEDGGFYSLEKPGDFKVLIDVGIYAAMRPPAAGLEDIPDRLKRHFAVFSLGAPHEDSVDTIFSGIVSAYLSRECAPYDLVSRCAVASRGLLQALAAALPRTAERWHYDFNMRDLVRVCQGLSQCPSEALFLPLWKYNCDRVFSDRLVDPADLTSYDKAFASVFEKHFVGTSAASFPAYFVNFSTADGEPIYATPSQAQLSAVSQTRMDVPVTAAAAAAQATSAAAAVVQSAQSAHGNSRPWIAMADASKLTACVEGFLRRYNEEHRFSSSHLVLFEDTIRHIIAIHRILSLPRGNALLIGPGGSGRRSLCNLASYIAGHRNATVRASRGHGLDQFLADVRNIYRSAVASATPQTLVLTENEVRDDETLDCVNRMLISGEITGLFKRDELETILADLVPAIKRDCPSRLINPYRYFIDRVINNLHVVLCLSADLGALKQKARNYPGLTSACQMVYFADWPKEALSVIAERVVVSVDSVAASINGALAAMHTAAAQACPEYFKKTGRRVDFTPRTYLVFLDKFRALYEDKSLETSSLLDALKVGLERIDQTSQSLTVMSDAIDNNNVRLGRARRLTEQLLADITNSAVRLEKAKARIFSLQGGYGAGAGNDAHSIAPAVAGLDENPLGEAVAVAKGPVEAAVGALELVAALPAEEFAGSNVVAGALLLPLAALAVVLARASADAAPEVVAAAVRANDALSPARIAPVQRDAFHVDATVALRGSTSLGDAAGSVAVLVDALLSTLDVVRAVHASDASHPAVSVTAAGAEADGLNSEVAQLRMELERLQAAFDAALDERQISDSLERSSRERLRAASALLASLGDLRTGWQARVATLTASTATLAADSAVVAAYLSYAGPFNSDFRRTLWTQWLGIMAAAGATVSKNLTPVGFLCNRPTLLSWEVLGLPRDGQPVENAAIVTRHCVAWPLLIDPQSEGVAWLRQNEECRGLLVLKHTDAHFRSVLEECVTKGRPLLVTDIDAEALWADGALRPVLQRQTVANGRACTVMVGDKEIEYNPEFRLYLATKSSNPNIPPDLASHTTIVDFITTMAGLEEHLLNRVVVIEKPTLDKQRRQLLRDAYALETCADDLETRILASLCASHALGFAEDELLVSDLAGFVSSLSEARVELARVQEQLEATSAAWQEYKGIAVRGGALYTVVSWMGQANNMYETSLEQFLRLFDSAVATADRSPLTSKRIENVIATLTYTIHVYMSRGLFERDKVLFLMLLAVQVGLSRDEFTPAEFNFVVRAGSGLDARNVPRKVVEWLSDEQWQNLAALGRFPLFADVIGRLQRLEPQWRPLLDHDKPETATLPDGLDGRMSRMQRLMLVRAFRPDRLVPAGLMFVRDTLGRKYVEALPLNLELAVQQSDSRTPLLLILSPEGTDPLSMVESLARREGIECRSISLGQGQERLALQIVERGMQAGHWVVLQNGHLGLQCIAEVDAMVAKSERVRDNFRLWITTAGDARFPVSVVQGGIKIVTEPSVNLRDGLKRSFLWLTQEHLDSSVRPEWVPFLYSASFLHNAIRVRRKFGAVGWHTAYDWNMGDLAAAVRFAEHQFSANMRSRFPSWPAIRYLISEIIYGGHITDIYDQRLMNVLTDLWIGPQVCNKGFEFYNDYKLPSAALQKDVTPNALHQSVDQLPLVDTPEVYGLHASAEMTFRMQHAAYILDSLATINPTEDSVIKSRSRLTALGEVLNDVLHKLPKEVSKEALQERMKKPGGASPMNLFLAREIDCLQRLLNEIKSTVKRIKSVIKGQTVATPGTLVVMDALLRGLAPKDWTDLSWDGEQTPLSPWLQDITQRGEHIAHMVAVRERTAVLWIGGFFNPQALLTVIKQEAVRSHPGWSHENVELQFDVTSRETVRDAPAEGMYVNGFFLRGAGWDKSGARLTDLPSVVRGPVPLPIIHVTAVHTVDKGPAAPGNVGMDAPPAPVVAATGNAATKSFEPKQLYSCPSYRSAKRSTDSFVCELDLKTDDSPSKWVLRGVCCTLRPY